MALPCSQEGLLWTFGFWANLLATGWTDRFKKVPCGLSLLEAWTQKKLLIELGSFRHLRRTAGSIGAQDFLPTQEPVCAKEKLRSLDRTWQGSTEPLAAQNEQGP